LPTDLDKNEQSWPKGSRDRLYALLSHDLKMRAAMLVALWDGNFNQFSGGTGDTLVDYLNIQVQADYANITGLGATDQRPGEASFVYWIPVSRASTNTSNVIGFSLKARSSFNYPFCWKALNGSFLYSTSLTDTILS